MFDYDWIPQPTVCSVIPVQQNSHSPNPKIATNIILTSQKCMDAVNEEVSLMDITVLLLPLPSLLAPSPGLSLKYA
jgi:hypothetical protein